jgi:glutamate-1-semialdehyde 2,1-aminomutase
MSNNISERAATVIPGGVNSGQRRVPGLESLVVTRTSGATFSDATGRTYIDFHAAFGPPLLGHNDPDVDAAVTQAIRQADLMGVGVTEGEVQLAEQLVELLPSVEKVLLTSTGSEATFHALRVSRAATGRRLVIKFQGCYHGWHDSVSMNVISAPDRVGQLDPISQGILPEVLNATLVLPFNDSAAVRAAFAEHGADIAAVIVEPVPHNIGCVLPEQEFLQTLRDETTKAQSVLIFDEVITGFRHALGGWQSICGITPDLTTMGKAIANGYPLAAIGGHADLMDLFSSVPGQPVFFAGTYNGHPGVVAAALAALRKMRSEPVHEHIFALGEQIRTGLREIFDDEGVPAVVAGYGSVFVTYFMTGPAPRDYSDLLRNDATMLIAYRRELAERGIFELPLNLKRSHVSYAHTVEHVERLLAASRPALQAALRSRDAIDASLASTMGGAVTATSQR